MHAGRILAGLAFATLFLIGTAGGVSAQDYTRKQWWPSEWGPDDQLGALNRLVAGMRAKEPTEYVLRAESYASEN